MSRVLFILLTASAALAAPAPKAKEKADYFPTREGDKREYEQREGDKVTGRFTDVVTKVEKRDDELHVAVTRDYPDSAPFLTTIAVSPAGVVRVAVGDRKLDKPAVLLKLPPKVGTAWDEGGMSYTIAKEEEIEVPAGKFKTIRVDATRPGRTATTHLWFAPGVGLVKMAGSEGDGMTVLKSFTPGK